MVARRANAGDPLAQHELGIRYLTGKGFAADTVKAAYWIRKAAEQHVVAAQYNLGILLSNGWGVEWNPFEAYVQVRSAAEHQMPQAQYLLSQLLTDNLVVRRNLLEALRWVRVAADSGYAPAKDLLPRLERLAQEHRLTSDSSTGKQRNTKHDHGTPARNPLASQAYELVFLESDEDSVAQVDERVLLREALSSGNAEARNTLGLPPQFDDTLRVDSANVAAVRRSADAGSPEALTVLGRCYEKGIVVGQDIIKGAACYVRALRLDSPRAGALLWSMVGKKNFGEQLKRRAVIGDSDAQYAWVGLFELGWDPLLSGEPRLTEGAALRLLLESSAESYVPSLVELGVCYSSGRWTNQDWAKAEEAWKRAAALGSLEAEVRRAIAKIRSSRDSLERTAAIQVLWGAAQQGSILAVVALAYCREVGIGLSQQKGDAAKLYYSAAARGSQDAYYALVRMYDTLRPDVAEFRVRE